VLGYSFADNLAACTTAGITGAVANAGLNGNRTSYADKHTVYVEGVPAVTETSTSHCITAGRSTAPRAPNMGSPSKLSITVAFAFITSATARLPCARPAPMRASASGAPSNATRRSI